MALPEASRVPPAAGRRLNFAQRPLASPHIPRCIGIEPASSEITASSSDGSLLSSDSSPILRRLRQGASGIAQKLSYNAPLCEMMATRRRSLLFARATLAWAMGLLLRCSYKPYDSAISSSACSTFCRTASTPLHFCLRK